MKLATAPPAYRSRQWYIDRRRRLRTAVNLRGQTVTHWAHTIGVSRSHLYHVLHGTRTSITLDRTIADVIAWAFGADLMAHFYPQDDQ